MYSKFGRFREGFIFSKLRICICKVSWKQNPHEMAKSLCQLLITVNFVLVANLNIASMSFNAIRESKILVKISRFTVLDTKATSEQSDKHAYVHNFIIAFFLTQSIVVDGDFGKKNRHLDPLVTYCVSLNYLFGQP